MPLVPGAGAVHMPRWQAQNSAEESKGLAWGSKPVMIYHRLPWTASCVIGCNLSAQRSGCSQERHECLPRGGRIWPGVATLRIMHWQIGENTTQGRLPKSRQILEASAATTDCGAKLRVAMQPEAVQATTMTAS